MAEQSDKESKTEEPTEKRLSKARSEGNVPSSQEMKSLVMLLAGLATLAFLAPLMIGGLTGVLSDFLSRAHAIPTDAEGVQRMLIDLLVNVGWLMAPMLLLLVVMALAGSIGQVGLLYTPKKMKPKLSAISPVAGIKKVISVQKLIDFGKDILKIGIVALAVAVVVVPNIPHPDVLVSMPFSIVFQELWWLLVLLLLTICVAFAAVAVFDMWWTRHHHKTKLKMTKQEVKDEHKQVEGDPQVKGRIRSMRMQRHRGRMMAEVPDATVVITNPTHYAVALSYDMDAMAAPRLVAKGADFIAQRIREVATENNVPIVENPPLARAIYATVELDEEIPADHYKAVAEVIGYVMSLKAGKK